MVVDERLQNEGSREPALEALSPFPLQKKYRSGLGRSFGAGPLGKRITQIAIYLVHSAFQSVARFGRGDPGKLASSVRSISLDSRTSDVLEAIQNPAKPCPLRQKFFPIHTESPLCARHVLRIAYFTRTVDSSELVAGLATPFLVCEQRNPLAAACPLIP